MKIVLGIKPPDTPETAKTAKTAEQIFYLTKSKCQKQLKEAATEKKIRQTNLICKSKLPLKYMKETYKGNR